MQIELSFNFYLFIKYLYVQSAAQQRSFEYFAGKNNGDKTSQDNLLHDANCWTCQVILNLCFISLYELVPQPHTHTYTVEQTVYLINNY